MLMPTSAPSTQPAPAPVSNVAARLAKQDASGVYVPDELLTYVPPPRARICDTVMTGASGCVRRALDVGSGGVVSAVHRVRQLAAVQRLAARQIRDDGVYYFVVWSGRALSDGSWEKRDALLRDVPALVRMFDVRHPLLEEHETLQRGTGGKEEGKEFVDDVSGLRIPAWVDSPIVELTFSGMVLQIRRGEGAVLHNDAASAVRDTRRRQARLKSEAAAAGGRLFALTRSEARAAVEASVRVHRQHCRLPIVFPRGVGRVAVADDGIAFSVADALRAPACWEGALACVGMKCVRFDRVLKPHLLTADEVLKTRVAKAGDEVSLASRLEHRERARQVVREAFRHSGAPPPRELFRGGEVRIPPQISCSKRVSACGVVRRNGESDGVGLGIAKSWRSRDQRIETALRALRKNGGASQGWYDEVWGCWRS